MKLYITIPGLASGSLASRQTLCIFAAVLLAVYGTSVGHAEERGRGEASPWSVEMRPNRQGKRVVEVRGFTKTQAATLRGKKLTASSGQELLAIHVGRVAADTEKASVFGSYAFGTDGVLRFTPAFPFRPGLDYTAVFRPANVLPRASRTPITAHLAVPPPPARTATRVTAVYPAHDLLPENLLRLYLHFSNPMEQGDSYRHLRLLKSDGQAVDLPFLELEQELWDRSGKRLTVLFDPGRIKRGLKPREESGPVLEEGQSYTLVIDGNWRDARGAKLAAPWRRTFKAGAPDDTQPDPAKWKLFAPRSGTSQPLRVGFQEPLDRAMLQSVVRVVDAEGREVPGDVRVDAGETGWSFVPRRPWSAAGYALLVDSDLEDRAGNNIERPFEVDIVRRVERRVKPKTLRLPFRPGAGE